VRTQPASRQRCLSTSIVVPCAAYPRLFVSGYSATDPSLKQCIVTIFSRPTNAVLSPPSPRCLSVTSPRYRPPSSSLCHRLVRAAPPPPSSPVVAALHHQSPSPVVAPPARMSAMCAVRVCWPLGRSAACRSPPC
jgi:hypothetical protein